MSELFNLLFTKLTLPPASEIRGKTTLITGANTGLGRETARHALALGADKVILGVRTLSKGEDAKADIEQTTGTTNKVLVWPIDMESFASVGAFADRAKAYVDKGGKLDIAIMNAGIGSMMYRVTDDGWERTLQINVLSTALLSLILLPLLVHSSKTAPSSSADRPHLTIIASDAHRQAKFPERNSDNILHRLNEESQWAKSQKDAGMLERYAVSKLFAIFITIELARLVPRDEKEEPIVLVNCLTPGFCKSDLLKREKAPLMLKVVQALTARTVEEGSKTYLYAATRGLEGHGKWFEHQVIGDPGPNVTAPEQTAVREKVWEEIVAVLKGVDPALRTGY
ncbi:putative short-chain dehydrogenase [Aspergillus stella-maris]|uniref:putative short-chain dehydrogenase n=1 Tax=Aspergillus stella-maris TaxID=1810926 RepID=UPI003CCCC224